MLRIDTSEVQRWGGFMASEVQQIGRRIETAVAAQTTIVAARAVAKAPYRHGALQGSIRPLGKGLRRRVRAGNNKAFYAGFQEFGTRKMAANPFLLEQANQAAHAEFEARVRRALEQGEIFR